jgi:hypothetical protein
MLPATVAGRVCWRRSRASNHLRTYHPTGADSTMNRLRPELHRTLPIRALPAAALALAALLAGSGPSIAAEEKPPAPQVTIESIAVTPPQPGPDTLCQLRVTLRNHGAKPASELAFEVHINGTELPVYRRHLFMQRLDPGAATELRLFNFWSSETARPAPADGRYTVEVALIAARWYDITREGEDEVWTPGEAIGGLPAKATATLAPPK